VRAAWCRGRRSHWQKGVSWPPHCLTPRGPQRSRQRWSKVCRQAIWTFKITCPYPPTYTQRTNFTSLSSPRTMGTRKGMMSRGGGVAGEPDIHLQEDSERKPSARQRQGLGVGLRLRERPGRHHPVRGLAGGRRARCGAGLPRVLRSDRGHDGHTSEKYNSGGKGITIEFLAGMQKKFGSTVKNHTNTQRPSFSQRIFKQ